MVREVEVKGKEICDEAKINDEIKVPFEEVFKCHKGKSFTSVTRNKTPWKKGQGQKINQELETNLNVKY